MVSRANKRRDLQLREQLKVGRITRREYIRQRRELGFKGAGSQIRSQRVKATSKKISEQYDQPEQKDYIVTKTESGTRVQNIGLSKNTNIQASQIGLDSKSYQASKPRGTKPAQKGLSFTTIRKTTSPVYLGSPGKMVTKTAEVSFRLGTGEQVLKYDDGRKQRLNINPYAELVRQGGSVKYSRSTGGRQVVTDFSSPGSFKKTTTGGIDIYSPQKPVDLIISGPTKPGFPAKPPKTESDIKLEKFSETLFEAEQRVERSKGQLYLNLGLQRKPEDESLSLKGVGKTLARFPIEAGSGIPVIAGRVVYAGRSLFAPSGRKFLGESFKLVPGAIKQKYDPRTSEGAVNIGIALLSVGAVAKNIRVQRALKQPKTDYKIKYTTERTTTKSTGFKTKITQTQDKVTGYKAVGIGKDFKQIITKKSGSDVVRSISKRTIFGRKFVTETKLTGTKGTGTIYIEGKFLGKSLGYRQLKTFKFNQKAVPFIETKGIFTGKNKVIIQKSYTQEISSQKVIQGAVYKNKAGRLEINAVAKSVRDLRGSTGISQVYSGGVTEITIPKGSITATLGNKFESSPNLIFSETAKPKLDVIKFGKGGQATYQKQAQVYISSRDVSSISGTGTFIPKRMETPFLLKNIGKRGSASSITIPKIDLIEVLRPERSVFSGGDIGGGFVLPSAKTSGQLIFPYASVSKSKNMFKSDQITSSKTFKKEFQALTSLNLLSPQIESRRRPIINTDIYTSQNLIRKQEQRQRPKVVTSLISMEQLIPATPGTTTLISGGIIPPPPPPPPVIIPGGLIGFDFTGSIPRKKRRSGKKVISKVKYKSDVTSRLFGLSVSKTPTFITPFTNRPLIRQRKKKAVKSTKKRSKR